MSLTKVTYSMIDGATVNVLDYGADPTGVADSSAAIQTAINTGLPVYVPAGTYKLTTTITNASNLILFGEGGISVQGNAPQNDKSGANFVWAGSATGPVLNIEPDVATSLSINNIKIYVDKTFTGVVVYINGSLVAGDVSAILEIDGLGIYRTPLDYSVTYAPGNTTAIGVYVDLTQTAAGQSHQCVGYKFNRVYMFNLNIGFKIEVLDATTVGQANFFNSNYFSNIYMYQVYRALDCIGGGASYSRGEISANTFMSFQVQPGLDSSFVAADGCIRISYRTSGNVFIGLKIWDIPDNKKLASSNLDSDPNGFFVNYIYGVYTGIHTDGFLIENGLTPVTSISQYKKWAVAGNTKLLLTANVFQSETIPIRSAATQPIPAGGDVNVGFTSTVTSNFGVFFGSGVPTLSAAKGSLYLRSDGSSTSTRMYVNTDGAVAWTAVTTAT